MEFSISCFTASLSQRYKAEREKNEEIAVTGFTTVMVIRYKMSLKNWDLFYYSKVPIPLKLSEN